MQRGCACGGVAACYKAQLLTLEHELSMDKPATFLSFGDHINTVRTRLTQLLEELRGQGKSIAGYGAPTKATTLLMHFGLGRDVLDFTFEDNPMKHGCYIPGALVPIVPASELYDRDPDYLVILAWNFAVPIMEKHAEFHRRGGRFILPMPDPVVVQDLETHLRSTRKKAYP